MCEKNNNDKSTIENMKHFNSMSTVDPNSINASIRTMLNLKLPIVSFDA